MATEAVRGIFYTVPDQVPVKCIFIGFNTLQAMTRHFMGIFMAAGAQFYNFGLGSVAPHAMGKMGVKIFGPVFFRVAADTTCQGFIRQGGAVAPHPLQRTVHAVGVAVFAGRQILWKRFGIFGRAGAMDAGIEFLDHVAVGKFLIG